jgi:hypothetical protein
MPARSQAPRGLHRGDSLAGLVAEDAGGPGQRLALWVVAPEREDLREALVDGEHARLAGLGLIGREFDEHRTVLLVDPDVLPLQVQQLTNPAPRRQQGLQEGA